MFQSVETADDIDLHRMWHMGYGREARKDTHRIWDDGKGIDFHCWLEDDNGNIIDRTPPAYSGKRHYKAFPKKDQTRIFLKLCKEEYFHKEKEAMTFFVKTPRERNCIMNSYAYKMLVDKKLKFVIGSCGFQIGDSKKIFWEFG